MQYNQTLRSQASKSFIKTRKKWSNYGFFKFLLQKHAVYSISYIFLSYSANESTTLAWNNQNIKAYPQKRVFNIYHVIVFDTTLLKILKLCCGSSVSLDLPVNRSDLSFC